MRKDEERQDGGEEHGHPGALVVQEHLQFEPLICKGTRSRLIQVVLTLQKRNLKLSFAI